eukprot:GILK01002997.1.p1 GENE.GILK01002997.1~~GILK01002997.1.p1  ORF type:complete len:326 (+),score=20.89 GILK01002997.1:55-1032(+)
MNNAGAVTSVSQRKVATRHGVSQAESLKKDISTNDMSTKDSSKVMDTPVYHQNMHWDLWAVLVLNILQGLIPPLLYFVVEPDKHIGSKVGYLRLYSCLDLAVNAPTYMITLYGTHLLVFPRFSSRHKQYNGRMLEFLSLFLATVFMYGHAVHAVGDAVGSYAEHSQYVSGLPTDLYALIHFMDEYLGHFLMFTAYYPLLAVWVLGTKLKGTRIQACVAVLLGVMNGLFHSLACIEGGSPAVGFAGGLCVYLVCVYKSVTLSSRRGGHRPAEHQVVAILAVTSTTVLFCGMLYYRLVIGSFEEPSAIGGFKSVLSRLLQFPMLRMY